MGSSWGETFGGLIESVSGAVSDLSNAVVAGRSDVDRARNAVEGEAGPVWSDALWVRQAQRDALRGTVEQGQLFNTSAFSASFTSTETILLFGAALLAGWAFVKFA